MKKLYFILMIIFIILLATGCGYPQGKYMVLFTKDNVLYCKNIVSGNIIHFYVDNKDASEISENNLISIGPNTITIY